MIKSEYEISIWEDYLYEADEIYPTHYRERKIAIIGKNDMDSPCMAMEPRLVRNQNGTNSFSFKMLLTCREDEYEDLTQKLYVLTSGKRQLFLALDPLGPQEIWFQNKGFKTKIYKNPFLNFLTNERKIKVKWENKWYDFIIKNCQEDSAAKTVTYTCQDQWTDELSKTGYNIEFSDELQNNQGTIKELISKTVNPTKSDIGIISWAAHQDEPLIEKQEETVYEAQAFNSFVATDEINSMEVEIPGGSVILLYYTDVQNMVDKYIQNGENLVYDDHIQFVYAPNYETNQSNLLVTNARYYYTSAYYKILLVDNEPRTLAFFDSEITVHPLFVIRFANVVSSRYRAYHLIRKQQSIYDTRVKKYCDVFTAIASDSNNLMAPGDTIYKYTETKYKDPTVVNNLVFNSKNFVNTNGWHGVNSFTIDFYRPFPSSRPDYIVSRIRLYHNSTFYNEGLRMMSSYIPEGITKGEKYVFRYKTAANYSTNPVVPQVLTPSVRQYTYDNNNEIIIDNESPSYFDVGTEVHNGNGINMWNYYIMTCTKSMTRADIYNDRIGLFITTGDVPSNYHHLNIVEVQFFPLCYDESETMICPEQMDKIGTVSTVYTYFNKNALSSSSEDIIKIYEGTTDWEDRSTLLLPVYNNLEKIRSINIKQSNKLNILQKLAEIFDCRIEFDVSHNDRGELQYLPQLDSVPMIVRYINILPKEGEETGIGFIYGIDLKGIKRTIKSDQITTKLIVSPNVNEFATDGVCAIEKSKQNYPRAGFLLNFDYYINLGLLDKEELYNDLYDIDYIGYYYWLNYYNTRYDRLTESYIHYSDELTKKRSLLSVYEAGMMAASNELQNAIDKLSRLLNDDEYSGTIEEYIQDNYDNLSSLNEAHASAIQTIITCRNTLENYNTLYSAINNSVQSLSDRINDNVNERNDLIESIKFKDYEFNSKYMPFIREGQWSGQEYINDDLYYFDAENQARLASRPVISYDISVMRVNALEEFKNKKFNVGDISFIQDTEYFGYTYVDGILTPYKEKIIISEIISNFEEPEKDTIKVQNYKTEFEDLFQRLVSSMQDFQFRTIGYYRH